MKGNLVMLIVIIVIIEIIRALGLSHINWAKDGKSHINPMAGRFGRKSHQRKKVTSICQNYNGTAAVTRCFQKAKITQNTAHIGASVYFFFTF